MKPEYVYVITRREWLGKSYGNREVIHSQSTPFTTQEILALGNKDEVLGDTFYARELHLFNTVSCENVQYQIFRRGNK